MEAVEEKISSGVDSPAQWLSRPVEIVVEVRRRATAVVEDAHVERLVSEAVASHSVLCDGPLARDKVNSSFYSHFEIL